MSHNHYFCVVNPDMKKIHIIAIILIAVSATVLITASEDVSTYATFDIAEQTQDRVKIVGELDRSKEVFYKPEIDPNRTEFFMIDDNKEVKKVVLRQPKPQDFEMSESIVLTGSMDGDQFVADEILMKCPSKYKDEEIYLKSNS